MAQNLKDLEDKQQGDDQVSPDLRTLVLLRYDTSITTLLCYNKRDVMSVPLSMRGQSLGLQNVHWDRSRNLDFQLIVSYKKR